MGSILSLRHYSHDQIVHSHDHAQLVLGLSGCLDFEVEGRGSRVLRQTFAVVPAQARHACSSPSGSRCLVLDLPCDGSLLLGLGEHAEAGRRLFERPQALSLTPAQGQLVNWLASGPINDPVIAHQGAGLLLASLASERQPPRQQPRLPLASLDAYLDRHAAHPLQVADLARLAGLSVARFHSLFLAETGQTPMDYARSRRLHQAHELLLESSLAVGEIAARVGYARRAPSPQRWSASSASPRDNCVASPRQNRLAARQTNPSRLLTLCPSTEQESAWTSSNGRISNASNCASAPSSAPLPTPRHANPPMSSRSTSDRSACAPPARN